MIAGYDLYVIDWGRVLPAAVYWAVGNIMNSLPVAGFKYLLQPSFSQETLQTLPVKSCSGYALR